MVGNRRARHQDLQGCTQHIALPDAGDISIAGRPVLPGGDALPLWIWDQATSSPGSSMPEQAVAQGLGILSQAENPQSTIRNLIFKAATQLIKTDIAGISDAVEEIQCPKTSFIDHTVAIVDPIYERTRVSSRPWIPWTKSFAQRQASREF